MLSAACPTKCRCWNHTDIGLVVKCRGLNAVPDNIPDAANVIDMSENFLREFDESNNFDNCSNVKKLNLGLTRYRDYSTGLVPKHVGNRNHCAKWELG